MAEPIIIVRIATKAAGFIKDNWKTLLPVFLTLMLFPYFVYVAVTNILLPQIDKGMLGTYIEASENNEISLGVLLSYDTIRYFNNMSEVNPGESAFDFLIVDYQVYEVEEVLRRRDEVEIEENIIDEFMVTADGEEVEMAVEKIFKLLESGNSRGYKQIKEMLENKYFSYQVSREGMTIPKVTEYLKDLDKKDEYAIDCYILSADEIISGFTRGEIIWFNGLNSMLAKMYPEISDDLTYISALDIPEGKDMDYIPSIWPTIGRISSLFGEIRAGGYIHKGLDIAASLGTKIYSAASGKVIYTGWQGGYGNTIMICHGSGITTVYGHLGKIMIKTGQFLNKGDLIGLVGSTGRSTGPHLHYEIRINGIRVDPMEYLP